MMGEEAERKEESREGICREGRLSTVSEWSIIKFLKTAGNNVMK